MMSAADSHQRKNVARGESVDAALSSTSRIPGAQSVKKSLVQPIRHPGKQLAAGKLSDVPPPDAESSRKFKEGLKAIAKAERAADKSAHLVKLA